MTLCHSWQQNPHLSYEHSARVVDKIGLYHRHSWLWLSSAKVMCELKVSHINTDQEYRACSVVVFLLLVYCLSSNIFEPAFLIPEIWHHPIYTFWVCLAELNCGVVLCGVGMGEYQCVCTHECACCLWMTVSKDARCQWSSCRSDTAAPCLKPHILLKHRTPLHTHRTTPPTLLRGLLKPGNKTHSRVS